jgi:RES domain-containing protein
MTSGAGIAKHGGRINHPGAEALYLALQSETVIQEYQPLSSVLNILNTHLLSASAFIH